MITSISTHDGTVIVRDPKSGLSASGRDYYEALRELERLTAARPVKAWTPWGPTPLTDRVPA